MCRPKSLDNNTKPSRSIDGNSTCPFSLQKINNTTWLIIEEDDYGESPHIYARLYTETRPDETEGSIFIITDTGVGTERKNPGRSPEPEVWTIATFLEYHLNTGNKIPYLIITTHCHYDHILGLRHLVPQQLEPDESTKGSQPIVLASSHDCNFVHTDNIGLHSLCHGYQMDVPNYKIAIWAEDNSRITCKLSDGIETELDIITLLAPGHTPDSLCWYDVQARTLYVGDHVYEQLSDFSRNGPRYEQKPAPIMFPFEGNILEWWQTTDKLISFVERENSQSGRPRVKMAAGHITAESDALHVLNESKAFMARVLAERVDSEHLDTVRGEDRHHWKETKNPKPGKKSEGFTVVCPLKLMSHARQTVPFAQCL